MFINKLLMALFQENNKVVKACYHALKPGAVNKIYQHLNLTLPETVEIEVLRDRLDREGVRLK